MKKRTLKDDTLKKELLKQETIKYEILRSTVLNDISVVIQGKILGLPGEPYQMQLTQQCIESVRNFIPAAEIILSTWEGSIVKHLKYDKVIFNKDPGAVSYSDLEPFFFNNNNRQIVSTYNGLKAATKTYAVKMRGDCKFTDTDFVYYLKEFPRGEQYSFFKQRIIIPTKYSRNPRRIAQLIHPSDIFQVGLLEDLLSLWSIPLQPEPETTRAIPVNKKIFNNSLRGGIHRMKFGAEQYTWYAFCKMRGLDLELKYFSNLPVSKILASDVSIINNFVIQDALKLGIILPAKMFDHYDEDLYTHEEWMNLSKRYAQKISGLDKFLLIAKVYQSNVSNIIWRVQHRLFKYGLINWLKTFKRYLSS